jgi:hypothetical protein
MTIEVTTMTEITKSVKLDIIKELNILEPRNPLPSGGG